MKKEYRKPTVENFNENVNAGVPGAMWGAALMVARALAKAMKGGIDLTAGADTPKLLQNHRENKE